jgi:hypothetical protein
LCFLIAEEMALPYGLPQRCLQAVAACWLISYVLSFVTGGCSLVLFTYLAVVALPAVAIYSFMNVSLEYILSSIHMQFQISNNNLFFRWILVLKLFW